MKSPNSIIAYHFGLVLIAAMSSLLVFGSTTAGFA